AAAAGLRWLAACAMGFAGLLLLSLALAGFERSGSTEPAETSASAYLDFDLAVLRIAALRNLGGGDASAALWAHRPDWGLRPAPSAATPLVPLREAWAASVAEKSRFRTGAAAGPSGRGGRASRPLHRSPARRAGRGRLAGAAGSRPRHCGPVRLRESRPGSGRRRRRQRIRCTGPRRDARGRRSRAPL